MNRHPFLRKLNAFRPMAGMVFAWRHPWTPNYFSVSSR